MFIISSTTPLSPVEKDPPRYGRHRVNDRINSLSLQNALQMRCQPSSTSPVAKECGITQISS